MAAVVKQGEIVEQGSHGELIQIPNGAYATLVRLQASAQHPALQQKQQPISQQLQYSADPEVLQKVISSQVRACSVTLDSLESKGFLEASSRLFSYYLFSLSKLHDDQGVS